MFVRFQNELNQFLIKYDISLQSGIFENMMAEIIGINPVGKRRFAAEESNQKSSITFTIPPLHINDLRKLFEYLEVPEDKMITAVRWEVSEKLVFEKILRDFKACFLAKHAANPDEIKQYAIASRPILESMTEQEIQAAIGPLIQALNNDEEDNEFSELKAELFTRLLTLDSVIDQLKRTTHFYHQMQIAKDYLEKFAAEHPAFIEDGKYRANFRLLLNGLSDYGKYNRTESVIAADLLIRHLKLFLAEFGIENKDCHFFEETLLKMAGIESPPIKCNFAIGSDRSRAIFRINGINKDDAATFISYFKKMGDETAKEGMGNAAYSSFTPHAEYASGYASVNSITSACVEISDVQASYSDHSFLNIDCPRYENGETHSFEVDAKILYQKIYPMFQAEVSELHEVAPEIFIAYKDKMTANKIIDEAETILTQRNFKQQSLARPEAMQSLLPFLSFRRTTPDRTNPDYITCVRQALEGLKNIYKEIPAVQKETKVNRELQHVIEKLSDFYRGISAATIEPMSTMSSLDDSSREAPTSRSSSPSNGGLFAHSLQSMEYEELEESVQEVSDFESDAEEDFLTAANENSSPKL